MVEDLLHDPSSDIGVLILMILGLMALFLAYPMLSFAQPMRGISPSMGITGLMRQGKRRYCEYILGLFCAQLATTLADTKCRSSSTAPNSQNLDANAMVGWQLIPQEPMSMSLNFDILCEYRVAFDARRDADVFNACSCTLTFNVYLSYIK